MRPSILFRAALLALLVTGGAPCRAADDTLLTGTLRKAAQTGEVVIGYRAHSIPFSFLETVGRSERPVGYAIDLCGEIVEDIGRATGHKNLRVRYERVTSDTRIDALTTGRIDLECGSTTTNAERRRRVAFSPVTFISETKLLVKRDAGIASYRDLNGRRIVVTAGTTNEGALRAMLAKAHVEAEILTARDHGEAFAMVRDGRADAFALDDVLLYGLKADAGAEGAAYTVLPDPLSFEPYALMFRKDDPQLAELVSDTFRRLAASRELRWTYDTWFLGRLPNGERLDIPMSSELRTGFLAMGLQD